MSSSLFSMIYSLVHGKPPATSSTDLPKYITLNPVTSIMPLGISGSTLNMIAPKLTPDLANHYADAITHFMPEYELTQEHLPMLLCQSLVESQYFTRMEENLFYTTTDALKRAWKTRFSDPTFASGYLRNPQKLGNFVYANRMGNGPVLSGDGYRNRGRGPFMNTGFSQYNLLSQHWHMSITDSYDYIMTPDGGVSAMMWFWKNNNMNRFTTYDQVDDCTLVINGGLNGLKDREDVFNNVINIV